MPAGRVAQGDVLAAFSFGLGKGEARPPPPLPLPTPTAPRPARLGAASCGERSAEEEAQGAGSCRRPQASSELAGGTHRVLGERSPREGSGAPVRRGPLPAADGRVAAGGAGGGG